LPGRDVRENNPPAPLDGAALFNQKCASCQILGDSSFLGFREKFSLPSRSTGIECMVYVNTGYTDAMAGNILLAFSVDSEEQKAKDGHAK
jgi:hypothetical protein